jgi:hypothetical protein
LETGHFEDLGVCGRTILKRMLEKEDKRAQTLVVWLRM